MRGSSVRALGLAACLLGIGSTAQAAQHLYHVNEIFTNADGSVQFIELLGEADQQGLFMNMFLCSGDTAIAPGQPGRQCFQFTQDLASTMTRGKSLLFASPGYVELRKTQTTLPAPDFVLAGPAIDPAKPFFAVGGDTIDFLPQDTRTAVVIFPAFPTDGATSFNGPFTTRSNANMTLPMNLNMGPTSPTNFLGETGTLTVASAVPSPAAIDADGDGVPAAADLCPSVIDPDQLDADGDRVGDACDSCVRIPNPRVSLSPGQSSTGGQIDDDADGFGNECDADFAGNGQVDSADLELFMTSMGKSVNSSTCGASGSERCAPFDVYPGALTIDADDLNALRGLVERSDLIEKCNSCSRERECAGPACSSRR